MKLITFNTIRRMFISKNVPVLFLLGLLCLTACEKDEPVSGDAPTAAFSSSVSDLEVTFSNSSTLGESFQWDFGDGNTSVEANPVHTFGAGGTYDVSLTAINEFGSHTVTNSVTVVESEQYKKEGYLLFSLVESSAGASYYGGYFEEMPSGDVDMTQYKSFIRSRIRAQYHEFLYAIPFDNENGLVKYAVDAETHEIVKVDEIPTIELVSSVVIIDGELGFYSLDGGVNLQMFNPTTMEELGNVDMSAAKVIEENDINQNTTLLYNKKLGKIYSVLYTDNTNTGTFFDANQVYIEVIDVESRTHEKSIVHNNAQYPVNRANFSTTIVDEDGNTYLIAQGSYGLDGQLGPTAPPSSRPQILKINTNSEFEEDYAFNPVNVLGFENNFFQLFVTMVYGKDNKAYGIATGGPESQELLALISKLGAGTITSAEYAQLQYLVLYSETQKVVEVDLVTKEVTEVSGIPFTAGFAYPFMYNYDGKIYTQILANGGTFNGFYEIDLETGAAGEAFNISAGGLTQQFIDISAGFRDE